MIHLLIYKIVDFGCNIFLCDIGQLIDAESTAFQYMLNIQRRRMLLRILDYIMLCWFSNWNKFESLLMKNYLFRENMCSGFSYLLNKHTYSYPSLKQS